MHSLVRRAYTLLTKDSLLLLKFLQNRSSDLITTLDCHDGVPLQPDMGDWITPQQAWTVVSICQEHGARFTRFFSKQAIPPGFPDVHQICGTYYSLLGENDDAYIAARAIQLFIPGIPQIYYVGLLTGINSERQRELEQDDRALNRRNYTLEEARCALNSPLVDRLLWLIRFRQNYPAFEGEFSVGHKNNQMVTLGWHKADYSCKLQLDLQTHTVHVEWTESYHWRKRKV